MTCAIILIIISTSRFKTSERWDYEREQSVEYTWEAVDLSDKIYFSDRCIFFLSVREKMLICFWMENSKIYFCTYDGSSKKPMYCGEKNLEVIFFYS